MAESTPMPKPGRPVLVVGHQRPDTDSAVAAYVYAALLNRLNPARQHLGIMLGPPTRQTQWLFQRAKVRTPVEVADLRLRVSDAMLRKVHSLSVTASLGQAIRLIQEHHLSVVPVLGAEDRVEGVLSDRLPMANFFYHFNMEDFLGVLYQLQDLVSVLGLRRRRQGQIPANGSLSAELSRLQAGDIFLCGGGDAAAIQSAAQLGAAAIIVCASRWERALVRVARQAGVTGVYQFRGTLLSLISQLPLALPVRNLMTREFVSLRADQTLDEARTTLARLSLAAPVLDASGRLVGVLSRSELLRAPRQQVVLVDHFERHQAGDGIGEAEIVEIVDHHRVGTIETELPVRVDCRPVGSSATIIALKFTEAGRRPTRSEALLLLGAILADTLALTSPTSTNADQRISRRLARRAGVDLKAFGREVLAANDDSLLLSADELVEKDLKDFSASGSRFGIGQVETVDRTRFDAKRLEELSEAMIRRGRKEGWRFVALMITDTLRGDTLAQIQSLDPALERKGVFRGLAGEIWPGCVSRKKQFLPEVLKRLGEKS